MFVYIKGYVYDDPRPWFYISRLHDPGCLSAGPARCTSSWTLAGWTFLVEPWKQANQVLRVFHWLQELQVMMRGLVPISICMSSIKWIWVVLTPADEALNCVKQFAQNNIHVDRADQTDEKLFWWSSLAKNCRNDHTGYQLFANHMTFKPQCF